LSQLLVEFLTESAVLFGWCEIKTKFIFV